MNIVSEHVDYPLVISFSTKRKPVEEKEPPRKKRKYVIKSEENYRKARQKYKLNDQSRDQFSKERTHSYSKSPDRSRDPSQTHLSPYNKSNDMDMDYEWSDEERRGDVREQPPSKRPPPPLIKHNLLSRYLSVHRACSCPGHTDHKKMFTL